jgi:hypothetical protein
MTAQVRVRSRDYSEPAAVPAITVLPVAWSAIWVGALAAIATTLILGLIGAALGAHQLSQGQVPTVREARFWSLAITVMAAFFSFVVGGWVAGKVSGDRRSEITSLHGAIAWLVAVPLLLLLVGAGSGVYLGTWFNGLAWLAHPGSLASMSPVQYGRAVRAAALGGVTALVLGLAGAILGGWMASGEPMSVRYRRAEAA